MAIRVLVADDDSQTLGLLTRILACDGYEVDACENGAAALVAACKTPPFVALLDVGMPEMNGYEVCRAFKADPALEPVPVLFLSGLDELDHRVRGFDAGGVDYIAKPIEGVELRARVRAHVQIRQCRERLEEMIRERTWELAEANRRLRIWDGCKDDWLNILTHELRTPITGVLSVTELLFLQIGADPDLASLREAYDASRARIDKLIDDAALLAVVQVESEAFLSSPVDIGPIVSRAIDATEECTGVRAAWQPGDGPPFLVTCNADLLERALADLLYTAVRCVTPPERIKCRLYGDDHAVYCAIETDGRQLDPMDIETFFDVGGQRALLSPGGDWGLRPPVAQRILSLFHGQAAVRNGEDAGICIEIALPRAERGNAGSPDRSTGGHGP